MSDEDELTFFQKFKQQKMKAWYPIPTLSKTIAIFVILGIIFIGLGLPMIIFSNELSQIRIRYDNQCSQNVVTCTIQFSITKLLSGPVFVYYQLNNFFQNHRLYSKSISYEQLTGASLPSSALESLCSPIVFNRDLYVNNTIGGVPLVKNAVAFPCGLVAYTIFNDSFTLQNQQTLQNVTILDKDIAWPSDIQRYGSLDTNLMWLNLTSQRVMNWIRISPMPNFRKGWGKIMNDLPAGDYNLIIQNHFYLSKFGVEKYFVLGNTNIIGTKSFFIPILYVVTGGLCFIASILFIVRKIRKQKNI